MISAHTSDLAPIDLTKTTCSRLVQAIPLHVPRLLIATVVLASTLFALVIAAAIGAATLMQPPRDLLASYRNFWPGQPITALDNLPCTGIPALTPPYAARQCWLEKYGPFQFLTITANDLIITEWSASMQQEAVGDLIEYWSRPDKITIQRGREILSWGDAIALQTVCPQHLPYHCPVTLLDVKASPRPLPG